MADKTTHFGRAGEFFAMSELLLRGWNVAVPVVDVGDDVFVIDDKDKTSYRVQVKSAEPKPLDNGRYTASFSLSRKQLNAPRRMELFYMFLVRISTRWRFLVVPREDLAQIRDAAEATYTGAGRPPVLASEAKADGLTLAIELSDSGASVWRTSLDRFLEQWPAQLPVIDAGPGTRSR
mgnify:FL=1